MKPLRILIVNRMAAVERGGGETFDLEMGRHLAALGHQVSYLCGWPLLASRRALRASPSTGADSRMTLLRSPFFRWFPWDRVRGGWRLRMAEFWIFEKLAVRWVSRHLDQFDVIQVCELPVFVSDIQAVCKKKRSTTVVVLRLTAPNVHDHVGGVKKADAVIASGTSIQKIRATLRPDCFDIPNAVDLARFCPVPTVNRQSSAASAQNRSPNPQPNPCNLQPATCNPNTDSNEERKTKNEKRDTPAKLVVLYVARFQAFKNHTLLLSAFRQVLDAVPDVVLRLAGSGPLRRDIEELAKQLGIAGQVEFLGEVPYEMLPDVYRTADVKVITSEYESFCFAAIEAMACGLPVVTTDCGWVPRLIGDKRPPIEKQYVDARPEPGGRFESDQPGQRWRPASGGIVVDRIDAGSLTHALRMMLSDPDLRATCGHWNRTRAEREHGWLTSAEKLVAVYEQIIENK